MRRPLRILAILALLCFSGAAVRAQSERIRDFRSDIQLMDDGTLLVRETITVISAGRQIRHGIFRDFPTRYKDRLGNNYVVGFQWGGAALDGYQEPSRVEDYLNGKRIYIGDNKYFVQNGEHTYVLTYSTNRQLGFFQDHDQLYWNVTGNAWGFPIDHAFATVTVPAAVAQSVVALDGFTGPQGSFDKNLTWSAQPGGQLRFETTGALRPREGLSIILSWKKGLIAAPTRQQQINYFLNDNRDAMLTLVALALLLLYYGLVWSAVGRDPKPGVIMPLYTPPADLSPAAMRYLVRMRFDNKTFAAAILDMAARGFLKIKYQAGSYTLYRTASDNRALTADEQQLGNQLFGGRDQLWLHNTNHTVISAGIKSLKTWLQQAEQKVYFLTNSHYLIPALIFSVFSAGTVAYLRSPVTVFIAGFAALWLSIWSLAVAGLIYACFKAWRDVSKAPSGASALVGKAVVFSLFTLPFVGGEGMGIFFMVKASSVSLTVLVFASSALHILFYFLLKAPTIAGRKLLDQVQGFKMFLGAVDGDRLNRVHPPEQTPETFEKFLPYALALDVEQAWAEKFSSVLNAASRADSGAGYSPSFYSGANLAGFDSAAFTSGFSDSFTGAISSSSSAPGSSDGGSGGSGGGGGGGGGGGW